MRKAYTYILEAIEDTDRDLGAIKKVTEAMWARIKEDDPREVRKLRCEAAVSLNKILKDIMELDQSLFDISVAAITETKKGDKK